MRQNVEKNSMEKCQPRRKNCIKKFFRNQYFLQLQKLNRDDLGMVLDAKSPFPPAIGD